MSRLWLDCEFVDNGHHIELLSIGIVRDDGATYYAEPIEASMAGASRWVWDHVRPVLTSQMTDSHDPAWGHVVKARKQIADEIIEFAGPSPEWWAYVDHYDWVALSQLYGPLVERPIDWPFGCRDLSLLAELAGICNPDELLPSETELAATHGLVLPDGAHHAIAGALWDRELWNLIQRRAADEPDLCALVASPT